jgi:hypothetical protein
MKNATNPTAPFSGQPDPRDVVVAHPLRHLEHGGRVVRQAEHAGGQSDHPGDQHADAQKK